jgi:hypothetical protein
MKSIKIFSIVPQSIQECEILIDGVMEVIRGAKEDKDITKAQISQQILDVLLSVKNSMIEAKKSLVVINPYSHTGAEKSYIKENSNGK